MSEIKVKSGREEGAVTVTVNFPLPASTSEPSVSMAEENDHGSYRPQSYLGAHSTRSPENGSR